MSGALEIAIGLGLVYTLFSVVCSGVKEAVAWFLQARAKTLEAGIKSLVNDPAARGVALDLAKSLYAHPLIKSLEHPEAMRKLSRTDLTPPKVVKPSYVSAATFVSALIDVLPPPAAIGLDKLRERLGPGAPAALKKELDTLLDGPAEDRSSAAKNLASAVSALADADAASVKAALAAIPHTPAIAALDALLNEADRTKQPALAAGFTLIAAHELPGTIDSLRRRLLALPECHPLRKSALALLDETVTDLAEARARLEGWFDDAMDRVSGYYKRWAQLVIIVIAIVVATLFNVDTLAIASSLARDPAKRAALVSAAQEAVAHPPPGVAPRPDASSPEGKQALATIAAIQSEVAALELPVGWPDPSFNRESCCSWLFKKILGVLLTAFALSLGAPFWFDLLGKLVNLRATGPAPDEKPAKPVPKTTKPTRN